MSFPDVGHGKTLPLRRLRQSGQFSEVSAAFGKVISKQICQSAAGQCKKGAKKTQALGGFMGLARGETGSGIEDPWDSSAENRISEPKSKKNETTPLNCCQEPEEKD